MAKQVKWNKLKIDEFLDLSGINYGIIAYDSDKCKEMKTDLQALLSKMNV